MNSEAKFPESLNSFYAQFWGDRWDALAHALAQSEKHVVRQNMWVSSSGVSDSSGADARLGVRVSGLRSQAFEIASGNSYGEISRGENGLLQSYVMDEASIWAAEALGIQPGDSVLDLCAAPGGKTLVLIEELYREENAESTLTANEPSPDRRERLTKVIQQYVPRSRRDQLWVTGRDGLSFGKNPSKFFTRILADVPCSGERHLLKNPTELSQWSPRRSEGLMKKQYGLLTAAFESLEVGGTLVYSTCSLSHLENEEVLRRFFKKRSDRAQLLEISHRPAGAEAWEFGYQILPDVSGGQGPLRWALLQKVQ